AIRQAARQEADVSIEQVIQDYFDLNGMVVQDRQHLDHVLNSALEQEWSGSVSQLSAQNIEDGTGFGGEDVIFPEGYGSIPEYLAERLDIQLNQTVTKISYSSAGVTVETEGGSFTADRVIVTLPLGILKKEAVAFDPPLPAEKQTVIQQMGVGVLNKVYLRFPEAFWQKRPEWFSRLAENRGEWSEWFNIHHYIDQPIILAFNAADFGTKIESWSDDQIVAGAMDVLRSMYGADIPEPESTQITRWIADPFAAGSYSFPAVGSPSDARSTLAESVSDRLFFAGEATHSDYPATVHGAYLSGIREAEKIMRLA
ncbi:MAG: NAD(P)/FAD-dependent oxidoreductase, partial [Chloroflexota bacterium]